MDTFRKGGLSRAEAEVEAGTETLAGAAAALPMSPSHPSPHAHFSPCLPSHRPVPVALVAELTSGFWSCSPSQGQQEGFGGFLFLWGSPSPMIDGCRVCPQAPLPLVGSDLHCSPGFPAMLCHSHALWDFTRLHLLTWPRPLLIHHFPAGFLWEHFPSDSLSHDPPLSFWGT